MKIDLAGNILKQIDINISKILVKIIGYKNNSTIIDIKGHQLDVPFLLNKDSKYSASIENGVLTLKEIKNLNKIIMPEKTKDIFDLIINLSNDKNKDEVLDIKNLFSFFISNNDILKKNNKNIDNNDYFIKTSDGNYLFMFELPFFDQLSKVFIKVRAENINLSILTDDKVHYDVFLSDIKSYLIKKGKKITINIFNNKKDFLANLANNNKIDIKI
jgi:hypothetical protein